MITAGNNISILLLAFIFVFDPNSIFLRHRIDQCVDFFLRQDPAHLFHYMRIICWREDRRTGVADGPNYIVLLFCTADILLLEKIPLIQEIHSGIEIGWDGGANINNVRALAHADLDVINVGAAISNAPNPAEAFHELVAEIDKNGVVL